MTEMFYSTRYFCPRKQKEHHHEVHENQKEIH